MSSGESKAAKFNRIAERRVNETLRALRLLGNLSDRRNYEYSEDSVAAMFGAIESEYRNLRARFKTELSATGQPFKFGRREG